MTLDWVYPVNDRSAAWGYVDTGSGDHVAGFMAGKGRSHGRHRWSLPHRLRQLHTGDRIWVRAALPIGAFIGMGIAASGPERRSSNWGFDVEWDEDTCLQLSADPVDGILEKRAQSTRLLTAAELRRLRRAVGSAASTAELPLGKQRRMQEVVQRQGQADFRARLAMAYNGRCAVTRCDVAEVLQASHIEPYNGRPTNVLRNGLLLRADIHDLFDRGVIWVTTAMKVAVHPDIRGSEYGVFHGKKLLEPVDIGDRPDPARLKRHRVSIACQSK